MNETWRAIPQHDKYEASSLGNIRNGHSGKVLKPRLGIHGYYYVILCPMRKTCKVHRLVAEAFHGPIPINLTVNHKDCNRTNNRPENLEYVTGIENTHHALAKGRFRVFYGENCTSAVLRNEDVIAIRANYPARTMRELSEQYGVGVPQIHRIIHRQRWKHI